MSPERHAAHAPLAAIRVPHLSRSDEDWLLAKAAVWECGGQVSGATSEAIRDLLGLSPLRDPMPNAALVALQIRQMREDHAQQVRARADQLAKAGREAFHHALAAAVGEWCYEHDHPGAEVDVIEIEQGLLAGIATEAELYRTPGASE